MWKGPSWLQVKENWPRQPDIKPVVESEKEVKISKELKSIVITTVEIHWFWFNAAQTRFTQTFKNISLDPKIYQQL